MSAKDKKGGTTNATASRLRELMGELPQCCNDFLDGIADRASIKTRLAYAYDLRVFLGWLVNGTPRAASPTDITLDDIGKLTARDIERYQSYLTYYTSPVIKQGPAAAQRQEGSSGTLDQCQEGSSGTLAAARWRENTAQGKMRKLSSLRSFFKYLFLHGCIKGNVAGLVPLPKLKEKPIVHLEPDESARLLDITESGESLTEHQLAYHAKLSCRDTAILTLMLGTGIRVSECVSLNISDVNFNENAFRVTRKGGDAVILYFSDEVAGALREYLAERKMIIPLEGHEDALFLSIQRRRLTARAVENLTGKYARTAAPLKKITPHKLRSTYGTQLYRESGDIYLVADVLGHADVNTTRRHYAAINEDRRRQASKLVKLR